MSFNYRSDFSGIRIVWQFEECGDEAMPRLDNGVSFMMDRYRNEICAELLLGVLNNDEWDEFKAGMSMLYDRVMKVSYKFHPLEGAELMIIKRICPRCRTVCGLAAPFCGK